MAICGPWEAGRYMERSLISLNSLCDSVVIVTNNVTEKEVELCLKYKVHIVRDDREWGKYQREIKQDAHKGLAWLNPDWVLTLDMDEEFAMTRPQLDELISKNQIAWHFYMVDLWGDEKHYKADLCFFKVQLYKYDCDRGFAFRSGYFDPGHVPLWAAEHAAYAPYFIRHFGLISPASRQRRVERYNLYDPEYKLMDKAYRDSLISNECEPLDEEKLRKELREHTKDLPLIDRSIKPQSMLKFHYLKRKIDGVIIDIPNADLHEAIKTGKFDYVSEVSVQTSKSMVDVPIIDDDEDEEDPLVFPGTIPDPKPTTDPLVCVLCGFKGQTEGGLRRHKTTKHA